MTQHYPVLATSTDGSPLLRVPTPGGTKWWGFELRPEGPVAVDWPNGTREVPRLVEWQATAAWRLLRDIQQGSDMGRLRQAQLDYAVLVSTKALQSGAHGVRGFITKEAHQAARIARGHATPPDIAVAYETYAGKLGDLLRRYEPPRSDGPTRETQERLVPDPVQEALLALDLDDQQWRAADEIRAVCGALAAPLVPHNGELGGHRGQPAADYKHPIERLGGRLLEAYEQRYRPWARTLMRERVNPVQRITRLQIVRSVVVDGFLPDQAAVLHGLVPPSSAELVVRQGLARYGRIDPGEQGENEDA